MLSEVEKSGDSGNFWPLTSWPGGAARATLGARVRALAGCVHTFLTLSPVSPASWVIAARFACNYSEVPPDVGGLPAVARARSRLQIISSLIGW